MDLLTSMHVLDSLEDELEQSAGRSGALGADVLRQLNRQRPGQGLVAFGSGGMAQDERVCMSTPAFGFLAAVGVALVLTASVAASFVCLRRRPVKA